MTYAKKLVWPTFILIITIGALHVFQFLTAWFDLGPISRVDFSFFLPEWVRPEPFKIPIYLMIMCSIAVGSVVLRRYYLVFLSRLEKQQFFLKIVPYVCVCLSVYFVWLLGVFPLFNFDQVTLPRTVTSIGYSLVWAGILIFLPNYLQKKNRWSDAVVIGMIVVFTYMPTFPVSLFDYSYFIGPAAAAAAGKTLYLQAPSQYGYGSILLFAVAEKFIPGILLDMGIYMWVLYVVEVVLLYIFFRKHTGSLRAGLLVVAAMITLSFFSIVSIPFGIPQAAAFRWTIFIATFLLIFKNERTARLWSVAWLTFLVVDVGLAINISLFLYWSIRFLAGNLTFRQLLKIFAVYAGGLLLGFFFFSLLSFYLSGNIVNPFLIFHTLSQYGAQGFGMLPLDTKTYFWVYVITMIISFFVYANTVKESVWSRSVLLSSLLFFTGAIYMVGRSHPHNLFNLSPLWLLNFFVLLTPFWRRIERANMMSKRIAYGTAFCLLIVFPAFCRGNNLAHLLREKIGRLPLAQHLPGKLRTDFTVDFERDLRTLPVTYAKETQLLQETFPQPRQEVVILALNSTYFHYLSEKPSLLWSDPLNTIIQQSDLDHALIPVKLHGCPDTIAIDPLCIDKSTCNRPPNEGISVAHDRVYEAFSKLCGRYVPVRCAGVLCIAKRI